MLEASPSKGMRPAAPCIAARIGTSMLRRSGQPGYSERETGWVGRRSGECRLKPSTQARRRDLTSMRNEDWPGPGHRRTDDPVPRNHYLTPFEDQAYP